MLLKELRSLILPTPQKKPKTKGGSLETWEEEDSGETEESYNEKYRFYSNFFGWDS